MKKAVDQFIHKFFYHTNVKSNNQNDRNFYPYIGNICFLKTYQVEGPRGKRNFWIDNKDERPAIEIEKISLQQSGYSQLVVEQSIAMPQPADESRGYIEQMARHYAISFRTFTKENLKEEMEQWLKEHPCLAVLCMTFPFKIPASILSIPSMGFINFHFALHPNYRGASPVFWQIKNREPFGGITVHQMDAGWDTGDLILTHKVAIASTDTHGMHWSKLAIEGVTALTKLLALLDAGNALRTEHQLGGAYYQRPAYADVKLDWGKQTASEILATIKACNPWNKGAFTFMNGREIRLVEAAVIDSFYGLPCQAPGSIQLAPNRASFAICCNDSKYIKPEIIYCDEGFLTPTAFSLLGFENGKALALVIGSVQKQTASELRRAFETVRFESPRGEFNFHPDTHRTNMNQALWRIEATKEAYTKQRMAQFDNQHGLTLEWINKDGALPGGWYNAYLCQ